MGDELSFCSAAAFRLPFLDDHYSTLWGEDKLARSRKLLPMGIPAQDAGLRAASGGRNKRSE
jgi:hypothetical protein